MGNGNVFEVMSVTAAAPIRSQSTRTKLDWAIVASSLLFMIALAVSAYFEPPIRILHTLQALIYVAVIVGALRHQKWAYGVGISIAAFWNYVNLIACCLWALFAPAQQTLDRCRHSIG